MWVPEKFTWDRSKDQQTYEHNQWNLNTSSLHQLQGRELKQKSCQIYSLPITKIKSLTGSLNDDSNDETVDTKHTSHDYWNNVLHHKARMHNTHGSNTNTGLSSTICSPNVWKKKEKNSLKRTTWDCFGWHTYLRSTMLQWLPWTRKMGRKLGKFRSWQVWWRTFSNLTLI